MSTTTEDRTGRKSPVDAAREGIPFNDLEDPPSKLAPETPLTREAVIHLRAAAGEVSRGFSRVSSILGAIKRGLYNPVVGDDLTLDEDTAFELRELCDAAVDVADHKMQRPVFERGRGERPHGGVQENGDGPGAGTDYDHPRGVFNQKYGGPNGDEVLVSVDRSGRALVRTFVPDDADRDAVVRTMERLLRLLEGPEPVVSENDGSEPPLDFSGQGDELADALFDESPSGRADDPLDAFEAVRRDTLEEAHEALLVAASIVNRHVDDRAWDTLGTVGYLEEVSCDLEDALGLDRNEVEELVNEAHDRANELLEGEDA